MVPRQQQQHHLETRYPCTLLDPSQTSRICDSRDEVQCSVLTSPPSDLNGHSSLRSTSLGIKKKIYRSILTFIEHLLCARPFILLISLTFSQYQISTLRFNSAKIPFILFKIILDTGVLSLL